MFSFKEQLFKLIPDLNALCTYEIIEDPNINSLRLEFEPNNEYGQESLCLWIEEHQITLSYDYYERIYNIKSDAYEEKMRNVIDVLKQILKEELLAVTTYNNINTSRVPILVEPEKAIKIQRRKNFRARSWFGTYDEDFT